jgi:hypothetical protein
MKNKKWKIALSGFIKDKKVLLDLVTMDEKDGQVSSLGYARVDGKRFGTCEVKSHNLWAKLKKTIQERHRDRVLQTLAHNLAKGLNNGRKNQADKLAAKWLGVSQESIRKARSTRIEEHFDKIGCNPISRCYYGDDGKQISFIFLDKENFIQTGKSSFKYSGSMYYWVKDDPEVTVFTGIICTTD